MAIMFVLAAAVAVLGQLTQLAVEIPVVGYGILQPSTGFLVAMLLATERRHWAGIVLLFFAAEFLILDFSVSSVENIAAISDSLASLAIVVIGCSILRWRYPGGIDLIRLLPDLRDFFLLAVAIAFPLGFAQSLLAPYLVDSLPGLPNWHERTAYELMSVLVFAPLVLAWVTPQTNFRQLANRAAGFELLLVGVVLAIILGSGLYGEQDAGRTTYHFVWAVALWAIFRFDVRVLVLVLAITTCFVAWKVLAITDADSRLAREFSSLGVAVAAYLVVAATVCLLVNALIARGRKLQTGFSAVRRHIRQLVSTIPATIWVYNVARQRIEYLECSVSERWWTDGVRNNAQSFLKHVHPDDRQFSEDRWQKIMRGGLDSPASSVYRFKKDDGSILWKRALTLPAPWFEDEEQRFAGIIIDVTDEQKFSEDMQRLSKIVSEADKLNAISALSAGLAHDWNNLILVLNSEASNLRAHAGDSAAALESAAVIEQIAEQGSGITGQLLTLARREEKEYSECDLRSEVSNAVELLKRALPRNITLTTSINCEGSPVVPCSGVDLSHLILNLGINARDAIGENTGTIQIDVDAPRPGEIYGQPADVAELKLGDDGPGIDDESLQQVFEPLYTTKADMGGTGLGLATVKYIVDAVGGEILLESELGRGTRMTIHLPVVQTPTSPQTQ
ncbi:MAG: ATP-binding protein [Woeseiaceae bacterium]